MSIFKNRSNVISYTVNKEIGSNCYVSVDGGEVVVNAPWYFSRKQIQTVIEEKKQWILNKIEEYQQQNMVYSDKGNIIVLGASHQVRLYYKSVDAPSINLVNRTIEVVLPNKYKKIEYVPVEYPPTEEILAEIEELNEEITKETAELRALLRK